MRSPGDDLKDEIVTLASKYGVPIDQAAARVAEACARIGRPLGDARDPLDLATSLDPTIVARPHLQAIADAFVQVLARGIDRIIITTPPQVGKTTVAAIWGPLWWLTHRPADRIILVSYGADLARSRGRAVRRLITRHGARYGLVLDPELRRADDWLLTTGGGLRTGGMATGVTGVPADLLVIDDPHKDRAEADSHQVKEAIWETYSSTLLTRLSPGAPIILIQTRWAPDDLAGRVLSEEGSRETGGRWLVIHLPAVASPDRFGPDPLGRAPGDPLPHPKIAPADTAAARAHWADKQRTSTVRDWASLYQGDPQPPEGQLVQEELLRARRHYQPDTQPRTVAVAVDPSGGGRDTAGIIGGWLGTDNRLYWSDDVSGAMSPDEWARAACQLAHDLAADRIIYEANYGRDMVRLAIRTAWDALSRQAQTDTGISWGLPPRLEPVHSRRGKLLRAEPIAQQLAEDRIRLAAPLLDLEAEWLTWRPTDTWSPGRIDASVHLAYALLPVPGASAVVSSPAAHQLEPTRASTLTRHQIQR